MIATPTPKQLGYTFPAEWHQHRSTWLTFPHKKESWPGKINTIYPVYAEFVSILSQAEIVCININSGKLQQFATQLFENAGANMDNIAFFPFESNDAWCRDHGPAFIINPVTKEKAIIDWGYNAWGSKYPPFELDDIIPTKIATALGHKLFNPGIVMEGGSVEFNGKGAILTSKSCLLNPNRNPHLNQQQIEHYLTEYYGANEVLWVSDGIVGDDTDGHIDDTVRFVNHNTVITMVEHNNLKDPNHAILEKNLSELAAIRLANGDSLNIIPIQMPKELTWEDQRLPASYANFYISNKNVIVPTFRDLKGDEQALNILQQNFPDRTVIGLDSTDIIWGLGSFHCLSQQEPLI